MAATRCGAEDSLLADIEWEEILIHCRAKHTAAHLNAQSFRFLTAVKCTKKQYQNVQGDVYTYIHVVASLAEHKHKYNKTIKEKDIR